jgi:hypothetical protein
MACSFHRPQEASVAHFQRPHSLPVFHAKRRDPDEVTLVSGHDRGVEGDCVGRDGEIEVVDALVRLASRKASRSCSETARRRDGRGRPSSRAMAPSEATRRPGDRRRVRASRLEPRRLEDGRRARSSAGTRTGWLHFRRRASKSPIPRTFEARGRRRRGRRCVSSATARPTRQSSPLGIATPFSLPFPVCGCRWSWPGRTTRPRTGSTCPNRRSS